MNANEPLFKYQKEFDRYMARPKEKQTVELLGNGYERHTNTYWDTKSNGLLTQSIIIKKVMK